jgi:hypothetical protein
MGLKIVCTQQNWGYGPAMCWEVEDPPWNSQYRFHREDGPAVEYLDGKHRAYWYKGRLFRNIQTQEEFERILRLQAFWDGSEDKDEPDT